MSQSPHTPTSSALDPEGYLAHLLDGLRMLVVTAHTRRTRPLVQALQARGAEITLSNAAGSGLAAARERDVEIILLDPLIEEESLEIMQAAHSDSRLRWAKLLRVDWASFWPDRSAEPDVLAFARLVGPLVYEERDLRHRLGTDMAFVEEVDRVGPSRILRAAAVTGPWTLVYECDTAEVSVRVEDAGTVDVVWREHGPPAAVLRGEAALDAFRSLRTGLVRIERPEGAQPRRPPSSMTFLRPSAADEALLAIDTSPTEAPYIDSDDTIERATPPLLLDRAAGVDEPKPTRRVRREGSLPRVEKATLNLRAGSVPFPAARDASALAPPPRSVTEATRPGLSLKAAGSKAPASKAPASKAASSSAAGTVDVPIPRMPRMPRPIGPRVAAYPLGSERASAGGPDAPRPIASQQRTRRLNSVTSSTPPAPIVPIGSRPAGSGPAGASSGGPDPARARSRSAVVGIAPITFVAGTPPDGLRPSALLGSTRSSTPVSSAPVSAPTGTRPGELPPPPAGGIALAAAPTRSTQTALALRTEAFDDADASARRPVARATPAFGPHSDRPVTPRSFPIDDYVDDASLGTEDAPPLPPSTLLPNTPPPSTNVSGFGTSLVPAPPPLTVREWSDAEWSAISNVPAAPRPTRNVWVWVATLVLVVIVVIGLVVTAAGILLP